MSRILFVVEGENRELDIFNNIKSVFFGGKTEFITIFVPAGMNIYMFYCKLKEDDFETDPIEIIKEYSEEAAEKLESYSRDDFAEIYYFFDFDEHGNNIPSKYKIDNIEALEQMLSIFDNETEYGKLYISYPMVEAFRDYIDNDCGVISGNCFRNRIDFGEYKHDSAKRNENNKISSYDYFKWMQLVLNFIHRICCLFGTKKLNRETYINNVDPKNVFNREMILYKNKAEIFILSALPEFLIDYFEKLWNGAVGKKSEFKLNDYCFKNSDKKINKK